MTLKIFEQYLRTYLNTAKCPHRFLRKDVNVNLGAVYGMRLRLRLMAITEGKTIRNRTMPFAPR